MNYWNKEIIELTQKLNEKLKIDHNNWHKLKGNKYNRSAELLSAALFLVMRKMLLNIWKRVLNG